MDLQEYNVTIKHRLGKTNTKADLLSQRSHYPDDNKNTVLLKEELFRNIEMRLDKESYHWLLLRQEIAKRIKDILTNKSLKE